MAESKHKNTVNDLSERFFLAIKCVGYTAQRIAKEVDGISQQTLTHIRTGRNAPSVKVIIALLEKFPAINANWLLTGRGEVLLEDVAGEKGTTVTDTRKKATFERVLDELSVDKIITYIHEHEKSRGFDENAVYKMFLKIRTQRKVIEELQAMEIRYKKELSALKEKKKD